MLSDQILVVDDDPMVPPYIRLLLSRTPRRPRVLVAVDGVNGSEIFLRSKPRVVITDLNMPRMNGDELISLIRATAPETLVILMSGAPVPASVQGYDAFFEKPFVAGLPKLVSDWIETNRVPDLTEKTRA